MLRLRCRRTLVLGFAVPLLALIAGCGEEASTKPKLKTREILGKKTQEVFDLKTELAKGAVLASTEIPLADPITQATTAYKTESAKLARLAVQHSIDLYDASNGSKPKTYEEFMDVIIMKGKPDGLWLPMLPYYQEYAYDADKKELVVIEYPAKKKALDDQSDRELGRK